MARYDEAYDRGMRGFSRGWTGERGATGRQRYDASLRGRDYDRDFHGGGWGMTRMYREIMRGERRPYNPPLGGRTEYSRGGSGMEGRGREMGGGFQGYGRDGASRVRESGYGDASRGRGGYRPDELHGVRIDRNRYDTGWR